MGVSVNGLVMPLMIFVVVLLVILIVAFDRIDRMRHYQDGMLDAISTDRRGRDTWSIVCM